MLTTEAQTNNDDCPHDLVGTPLAVGDYVRIVSYNRDRVGKIIQCEDIWGINQWVLTLHSVATNKTCRLDANQCQKLSDEEAMLHILEQ
jgi:hypothetical protein